LIASPSLVRRLYHIPIEAYSGALWSVRLFALAPLQLVVLALLLQPLNLRPGDEHGVLLTDGLAALGRSQWPRQVCSTIATSASGSKGFTSVAAALSCRSAASRRSWRPQVGHCAWPRAAGACRDHAGVARSSPRATRRTAPRLAQAGATPRFWCLPQLPGTPHDTRWRQPPRGCRRTPRRPVPDASESCPSTPRFQRRARWLGAVVVLGGGVLLPLVLLSRRRRGGAPSRTPPAGSARCECPPARRGTWPAARP